MTATTRESTFAQMGESFTLLDVLGEDGALMGTVRCADMKDAQSDASPWFAFLGEPSRTSLRSPGLNLGQFASLDLAVAAISASAG